MEYEFIKLQQQLVIDHIYTIHYFEYTNDFIFPGESHDFWEFLCVDKGEALITADDQEFTLKKDAIIFHKPNEFHAIRSSRQSAPNLVVISFECNSPMMDFFADRIMSITEEERGLLGQIIQEARHMFSTPLDNPYLKKMERVSQPPIGCDQMIQLALERLLLLLVRRYSIPEEIRPAAPPARSRNSSSLYPHLLHYLEENLNTQLSIEQICTDNLIGRSQLQKLFRDQQGCGIIDYFSHMKIDAAKQMMRTRNLNFTQIADALGYSSVHYFSRQFKKISGMTPSEYSSSIKRLADGTYYTK